jgi:5-methylcytosine-specific restriction endonuclease McrA
VGRRRGATGVVWLRRPRPASRRVYNEGMKRKRTMPTHHAIVEANRQLVERLSFVEPDREHATCWACGQSSAGEDGGWLQRAHVVAASGGGSDAPENFFLLCAVCHREQPDGSGREAQEAWLLSHETVLDRAMRTVRPLAERVFEEIGNVDGDSLKEAVRFAVARTSAGAGANHRSNQDASWLWNMAPLIVEYLRASQESHHERAEEA